MFTDWQAGQRPAHHHQRLLQCGDGETVPAKLSGCIRSLVQHAAAGTVIVYLITEELLREAHETDTGLWEVAVLFRLLSAFFLTGVAIG